MRCATGPPLRASCPGIIADQPLWLDIALRPEKMAKRVEAERIATAGRMEARKGKA